MKTIFFILMIISWALASVFLAGYLNVKNVLWQQDRALLQCIEATGITEQELQRAMDRQAQEKYQENLEPIDIFSEKELAEQERIFIDNLYDGTEEIYVELPPQIERVCVRYKHFFSQDICQEWAYPL